MTRSRSGRGAQATASPSVTRRRVQREVSVTLRRLCLVGVGMLAACRPARPPAPAAFIALASTTIETRETQLDGDLITVRLHIPPTPESRRPTVISTLGDRATLLKQGFLVVTYRINRDVLKPEPPPLAPAESAAGRWVLASASAATLGRDYLRNVAATAVDDIPKIVDYLVGVPEVDPARIAFAGNSTNGFVALQAVARDRRLVAAVVLAACGDYHRFLRYSSMGMEGGALALAPDYERWLRAQEVLHHPRALLHAAVLMVNRDKDPIIPLACADTTAEALSAAYARAGMPERFRYTVFAGNQHGLDEREMEETVVWLERWLRG
jgi:dienelactone hydrolase